MGERERRTGGRRVAAGELTLFSLHPLPCVPMCLNPTCPDPSLSSPLGFSLYLTLFFPFLGIPEGLSFFVSGSLSFSHGCVSVCCYFFPSLFSYVSLLCLFVLILVSISTSFSVRVSLSLSLYASFCLSLCISSLLSPSLSLLPPTPLSPSLYISAPFSPSLSPLLPARCSLRLACPHRCRFRGTCAERLSWGTFDGLER